MENNKKFKEVIKKAKEKGRIKTYEEFCKTKEAEETALVEEEVEYYTRLKKGEKDEKI